MDKIERKKECTKKITVVGMGYVGLPLAILLAEWYGIWGLEIDEKKVKMINNHISPIEEPHLSEELKKVKDSLVATTNMNIACQEADYIIIALPTNYEEELGQFNLNDIFKVVSEIRKVNKNSLIIIRSTLPVGGLQEISRVCNEEKILYMPEFIRETQAFLDNLYPNRVIYGFDRNDISLTQSVNRFHSIYLKCIKKEKLEVLFVTSKEAEAIKLFSNAYLALRVSFFNELDMFAENNRLNTAKIIYGVCLDQRIGNYYNNPSFGYGGYCLPKDTEQLISNSTDIPINTISEINNSNRIRKKYIANIIMKKCNQTYADNDEQSCIGIFRLVSKSSSDNFRNSAIIDIINELLLNRCKVIIYEPKISQVEDEFSKIEVINNIKLFKELSDIIVANRYDKILDDVYEKVYTRDIYGRD